jgi:hypothetical protein
MTSFIALPALGVPPRNFEGWGLIHEQWEAYLEIAAALHVAMNGKWIVSAARRLFSGRPTATSHTLDAPAGLPQP